LILLLVLTKAAAITENCRRLPSIVHAMSSSLLSSQDTFFLTHHIGQSEAGFFLNQVLIDGGAVLKVSHITFLALFTVLSRICTT